MSEQMPTVGRIVHYVHTGFSGKECQAAIVTKAEDGSYMAGLTAFTPLPTVIVDCLADFIGSRDGTWHWPERD